MLWARAGRGLPFWRRCSVQDPAGRQERGSVLEACSWSAASVHVYLCSASSNSKRSAGHVWVLVTAEDPGAGTDVQGGGKAERTAGGAQQRGPGGRGRMTSKFTYANINCECSTTQMKPRRRHPGWGAPSPTEGAWPQPGASLWRLCSPGETPLCPSLEGRPAALPPAGAGAPPAAGTG